MRSILQEWKRGRAVRELLPQARSIEDPSFAGEALFALSIDAALTERETEQAALEGLRFVDKAEREWRRGEALAEMARRLPEMRRRHPATGEKLTAALADRVLALPDKARTEAIRTTAAQMDPPQLARLMGAAIEEPEGALETAKAVLRAAVESGAANVVLPPIRAAFDAELRRRLLGAWASRMAATQPEESGRVLREALDGLEQAEEAKRLDIVRAVVAGCEGTAPLHILHHWGASQADEPAARILSALGARADRLGDKAQAEVWLREALARAGRIPDEKARGNVERNVHEGLRRMGIEVAGAPPPKPKPAPDAQATKSSAPTAGASRSVSSRHILALYDSYEGGLGDVHLRAIARAAPLCEAFGLDLALVGFPVKDLDSLVKRAGRTGVGEGRKSLEHLFKEGRLLLVSAADGLPDWKGLGTPVATTPTPDAAKATDFDGAAKAAGAGGRLCVLVGLGPKGLPDAVLRAAPHHVELTGRGVSLETATAMGIIAERVGRLAAS